MIERVARVILRAELERNAAALLAEGKVSDSHALSAAALSGAERLWRTRKDEARAAIEAMREMTPEMYEALSATGKMWREMNSREVYTTLIDGALK